MPDWFSRPIKSPYVFLIIGISLFAAALVYMYTGKASTRYRWVYRTKEPHEFWWAVAMWCLGGVFFVGIFLYMVA
jgi:hypothetical protein